MNVMVVLLCMGEGEYSIELREWYVNNCDNTAVNFQQRLLHKQAETETG
jgi:hypothetical protein